MGHLVAIAGDMNWIGSEFAGTRSTDLMLAFPE
jgi:hypothetical protein